MGQLISSVVLYGMADKLHVDVITIALSYTVEPSLDDYILMHLSMLHC